MSFLATLVLLGGATAALGPGLVAQEPPADRVIAAPPIDRGAAAAAPARSKTMDEGALSSARHTTRSMATQARAAARALRGCGRHLPLHVKRELFAYARCARRPLGIFISLQRLNGSILGSLARDLRPGRCLDVVLGYGNLAQTMASGLNDFGRALTDTTPLAIRATSQRGRGLPGQLIQVSRSLHTTALGVCRP